MSDLRVDDGVVSGLAAVVGAAAAALTLSGAVISVQESVCDSTVAWGAVVDSGRQRSGQARRAQSSLHDLGAKVHEAAVTMFATDACLATKVM